MSNKKKVPLSELLGMVLQYSQKLNINSLEQAINQLKQQLETTTNGQELQDFVSKFISSDALDQLINIIPQTQFEARKNIAAIINFVTKRAGNQQAQFCAYVTEQRPEILIFLLESLQTEYSLVYFQILQEFAKHEQIAVFLLQKLQVNHFQTLFSAMNSNQFEISSEACVLLRELLTRHAHDVTLPFLAAHKEFFGQFVRSLLESDNYASKRYSLHLLGDILLNQDFYDIMIEFINHANNLKVVMELLRDNSQAIKLEAFHIFKIFVAYPDKPEGVRKILVKNKDRIIQFLQDFVVEEIAEEKEQLIEFLNKLE